MCVYGFHQCGHMFRRRELVDPMAQVENEAGRHAGPLVCRAKTVQHALDLLGNFFGWGKQHEWIDIALQRLARSVHGATNECAGRAQMSSPIQTKYFAIEFAHGFEPGPAAFGQYDARNNLPLWA